MASEVSETQICNLAVGEIGDKFIADIDGSDDVAALCKQFYDVERDLLMSAFPWNFAMDREELAQSNITPDFEYAFQYEIPADMLRAWKKWNSFVGNTQFTGNEIIFDNTNKPTQEIWQREGNFLLTNSDEFKLIYIKRITDTTKFSPGFTRMLALTLALSVANKIKSRASTIKKELILRLERISGPILLTETQEGNPDNSAPDSAFSWLGGR